MTDMIEYVMGNTVEIRHCLSGVSVEFNGVQVFWVSHDDFEPEAAALDFATRLVRALEKRNDN
jgi:hypothetical protein